MIEIDEEKWEQIQKDLRNYSKVMEFVESMPVGLSDVIEDWDWKTGTPKVEDDA